MMLRKQKYIKFENFKKKEVEVYEAPQEELRAVLQTPGGLVTL